ncbi:MAG: mscL [Thermoleophilia bacterium]|nr:mscL [Thermoleophilia bacterium]MCZ4497207.1 mscL [Thermoleophilia bacterium]
MLREFREFLARGNVIDLAVGLIAGIVFGAVVNSLVNDVLMQVIAAIVGKPDFSRLTFELSDTPIRYGAFLTALLNFVLTMGAVFFFIIKPINAVTERVLPPAADEAPTNRECPECLGEVPAAARRCRFCASAIQPIA